MTATFGKKEEVTVSIAKRLVDAHTEDAELLSQDSLDSTSSHTRKIESLEVKQDASGMDAMVQPKVRDYQLPLEELT